jgi:hypothetical protein
MSSPFQVLRIFSVFYIGWIFFLSLVQQDVLGIPCCFQVFQPINVWFLSIINCRFSPVQFSVWGYLFVVGGFLRVVNKNCFLIQISERILVLQLFFNHFLYSSCLSNNQTVSDCAIILNLCFILHNANCEVHSGDLLRPMCLSQCKLQIIENENMHCCQVVASFIHPSHPKIRQFDEKFRYLLFILM